MIRVLRILILSAFGLLQVMLIFGGGAYYRHQFPQLGDWWILSLPVAMLSLVWPVIVFPEYFRNQDARGTPAKKATDKDPPNEATKS